MLHRIHKKTMMAVMIGEAAWTLPTLHVVDPSARVLAFIAHYSLRAALFFLICGSM